MMMMMCQRCLQTFGELGEHGEVTVFSIVFIPCGVLLDYSYVLKLLFSE